MNDLEQCLLDNSNLELRIVTTELGYFEVILTNDGRVVTLAVSETIEGALTKLEPKAARVFAVKADVWPG